MRIFTLIAALFLFLQSCSTTNSVANDKRTIKEKVVVVKSTKDGSILSTGRYGNWYKVDVNLNERMYYEVNLEIPRQKASTYIREAILLDFTPGDYVQKDLMAKYEIAYNQVKTGTN